MSFFTCLEVAQNTLSGKKQIQRPRGHWTGGEGTKNVREFFDSFAKLHGKDPTDPETWYSARLNQIHELPVREMMNKEKGRNKVLGEGGGRKDREGWELILSAVIGVYHKALQRIDSPSTH